jgi:hypothetical protein
MPTAKTSRVHISVVTARSVSSDETRRGVTFHIVSITIIFILRILGVIVFSVIVRGLVKCAVVFHVSSHTDIVITIVQVRIIIRHGC